MTTLRVSVRLDAAAFVALRRLEASGLSRSAAVRQALIASAAQLKRTDSPRADVLELADFRATRR
ncbi:MAG TPA: hypothetical protein VMQ81_05290 [Acidimicrobiia bacterium]|nr:hypothetical protein [Acidimicrobiia bacterium]